MLSLSEVEKLLKILFKFENKRFIPYTYQTELAHLILNKGKNRVQIAATTRAGKSLIVAYSALLYGLIYPGSKIRLIAPKLDQAKILMDYIIEHVTDHQLLIQQLPIRNNQDKLRLQQELSKKRIKWLNGTDIMLFSAHGDAERLQGFGGDLIIVDESPNVEDTTFAKYIVRMAEQEDSMIIQIGNPTKMNHFWSYWSKPDATNVLIDWERCVKDGRFTMAYVKQKANEMGGWDSPIFISMMGARFVSDATNALIPFESIQRAINRKFELGKEWWLDLGVDVARYGNDLTILTLVQRNDEFVIVPKIQDFAHRSNVEVSQEIIRCNKEVKEEYGKQLEMVKIDDLGLGGGVTDILMDKGFDVLAFKASQASNGKMFSNRKAEAAWLLRRLFIEDAISIPDEPRLIEQLQKMTFDYTNDGRIKIIDPEDKSPDFFDSLMIACFGLRMTVESTRIFN